MRNIDIDEELYAYLQLRAKAFEETPNDTIKRLLDIFKPIMPIQKSEVKAAPPVDLSYQSNGSSKKAKVNLPLMIREGILTKGQRVIFQDYRGTQYPDYDVTLHDSGLVWKGKQYSMSELAGMFLKELNHSSKFVRGPIFWLTEDGKTISELWNDYLNKHS